MPKKKTHHVVFLVKHLPCSICNDSGLAEHTTTPSRAPLTQKSQTTVAVPKHKRPPHPKAHFSSQGVRVLQANKPRKGLATPRSKGSPGHFSVNLGNLRASLQRTAVRFTGFVRRQSRLGSKAGLNPQRLPAEQKRCNTRGRRHGRAERPTGAGSHLGGHRARPSAAEAAAADSRSRPAGSPAIGEL